MADNNVMKPSVAKPWMKLWGEGLPGEKEAECTMYEYLYENNKDYLSNYALNYYDNRITFADFFKNIQQTARAYKALGVKKGDFVTVISVMLPETIYTFYALDLLGATPNMVDPRYSAHGIREYIEEVKSDVVMCISVAYPKIKKAIEGTKVKKVLVSSPADSLAGLKKIGYKLTNKDKNVYDSNVVLWKDFYAKGRDGEDLPFNKYDPKHAAMVVHTGGTTGSAKGVMLGDKSINANAMQVGVTRTKSRKERYLNIMPPFIAYGFAVGVHLPLGWGLEIILIPQFDPKDFCSLLKKYKPEHTAGVPLHYQILARDPAAANLDISFMETAAAGGDSISLGAEQEVNKYFAEHNSKYLLCKGYGMTELSSSVTACIKDINKEGSVGIPLYMLNVSVFKPGTDEELGFNEEGEVCVTGPNVMMGYYKKPEATKEILRKHSDGQYWIHTGDIGYMDEEGYLFIKARIKRVIIRHDGFKVFPTLIENAISTHPDVKACCAVGAKDADHMQGCLPVVHVAINEGCKKSHEELEKELREICNDELAEYVIPVDYEFKEELPYTLIGKVDYRKLEEETKDKEVRAS